MASHRALSRVNARRHLSESISEGDGISLLVQVAEPPEAVDAEASGAEGLVATAEVAPALARATALPLLVRGESAEGARAAGADAWLLVAELHGEELEERYAAARNLGLECVVDVQDDEELERALASADPEIFLLSARGADDEEHAVDRVLELLPDVPAGKLAIAELSNPTGDDVLALERAGVDAVLVAATDLPALVEQQPR